MKDLKTFFFPVHLSVHMNCKTFLMEAGSFFTEIMGVKSNSFLIYDKDFGFSYSIIDDLDVISLSDNRSALEYSTIFPFDVISNISIKCDGNYNVKSYFNGVEVKSIDIDKDIVEVIDVSGFLSHMRLPCLKQIKKITEEFSEKWGSFANSSSKFDFEKIIKNVDNNEIMRLLAVTEQRITHDWPMLFEMDIPLGFVGYLIQGLGKEVLNEIIEESSKFPSTFYLPGDEAKYNEPFVSMYKAHKAKMEMEGVLGSVDPCALKRKHI